MSMRVIFYVVVALFLTSCKGKTSDTYVKQSLIETDSANQINKEETLEVQDGFNESSSEIEELSER